MAGLGELHRPQAGALDESVHVAAAQRLPHPVGDLGHAVDLLAGRDLRRDCRGVAFDQAADAPQLVDLPARQLGHDDGAVGLQLQRLLGRQSAHRLTHRHDAGAQSFGQAPQGKGRAGKEVASHQRGAQLAMGALRQGFGRRCMVGGDAMDGLGNGHWRVANTGHRAVHPSAAGVICRARSAGCRWPAGAPARRGRR